VHADADGRGDRSADDLANRLPRQHLGQRDRADRDGQHDREEHREQPLPGEEVTRPDEVQRTIDVGRRERGGIAELDERRTLGLGGRDAMLEAGVELVADALAQFAAELLALGLGNGAHGSQDVAVGEGVHRSSPVSSMVRRVSAWSMRCQSAVSTSASRSPVALVR
jgi:hypothetical protein